MKSIMPDLPNINTKSILFTHFTRNLIKMYNLPLDPYYTLYHITQQIHILRQDGVVTRSTTGVNCDI